MSIDSQRDAPERIYLQVCEDDDCDDSFNAHGEVTWCADKINSGDVEYVRAPAPDQARMHPDLDLTETKPALNELRTALERFHGEGGSYAISIILASAIARFLGSFETAGFRASLSPAGTHPSVATIESLPYILERLVVAKMYNNGRGIRRAVLNLKSVGAPLVRLEDAITAVQSCKHECAKALATLEARMQPEPDYCPEKLRPGGCQLPNVHCGFPACNRPPKGQS